MKKYRHEFKSKHHLLLKLSIAFMLLIITFSEIIIVGWAFNNDDELIIYNPVHVGGASGFNNERDADLYPSISYDHLLKRYFVVWLSARNASSSSAGFDVYGIFLNKLGRPIGNQFRISDTNTVARNGFPTISSGNGEFVVAWTAKIAGRCQIYARRITNLTLSGSQLLASDAGHNHSPSLVFNNDRNRYTLVYVSGDDYQPPTLFGADTADCGNNPASTSTIKITEFYFDGNVPLQSAEKNILDNNKGAFRPSIDYSVNQKLYVLAWEDRRNANEEPDLYDVYAQRLNSHLLKVGDEISLTTAGDYTNYNKTATWTPRPKVAAGINNFLVTWFDREVISAAHVWSINGSLLSADSLGESVIPITHMAFIEYQIDQPPTGYLSAIYSKTADEYLVGMTSHLQTWRGYLSHVRIQRISNQGQLLTMDGSIQDQTSVGYFIDYDNTSQISMGLSANPQSGQDNPDYLVVYAKHMKENQVKDFDIWSVRVTTYKSNTIYYPFIEIK